MYNRITLIGTLTDHPQERIDPHGNGAALLSLKVPPPPDAPPTYWGLVYDVRSSDWPTGEDTFLVICRDRLLRERCVQDLHQGDIICVEGRLVLTLLRSNGDLVPLAEILASEVILLTRHTSEHPQET
jgi:single-stranded DNA-binding protein